MFVFFNLLLDCITYRVAYSSYVLYYVTSFSLFVMSCVCQLFNKEYMMMILQRTSAQRRVSYILVCNERV